MMRMMEDWNRLIDRLGLDGCFASDPLRKLCVSLCPSFLGVCTSGGEQRRLPTAGRRRMSSINAHQWEGCKASINHPKTIDRPAKQSLHIKPWNHCTASDAVDGLVGLVVGGLSR